MERSTIFGEGKRLTLPVIAFALLFLLTASLTSATSDNFAQSEAEILVKAVEYIRVVAYNPKLQLCREAPRVAPNVYWVASDNLLAFKALEPYDHVLASTIRSKLTEIAQQYMLPRSPENLPLSLRYDLLVRDDETLEVPPRGVVTTILRNDSYLLKYDIANGTTLVEDWREYADLRLLVALSSHNRGDRDNALSNLTAAVQMWDGIGLHDKAYDDSYGEGQVAGSSHAYATYKLGLLLYVSAKLGLPLAPDMQNSVTERIRQMQNQTSGGIFTHILPNGSHGDSDTNTETTAIIILGLSAYQAIPEFETTFTAIVLAVSLTVLWRSNGNRIG